MLKREKRRQEHTPEKEKKMIVTKNLRETRNHERWEGNPKPYANEIITQNSQAQRYEYRDLLLYPYRSINKTPADSSDLEDSTCGQRLFTSNLQSCVAQTAGGDYKVQRTLVGFLEAKEEWGA